ncbi:DUF445 domain-containing protein, partial [Micromonospora sp. AMSO31t]
MERRRPGAAAAAQRAGGAGAHRWPGDRRAGARPARALPARPRPAQREHVHGRAARRDEGGQRRLLGARVARRARLRDGVGRAAG